MFRPNIASAGLPRQKVPETLTIRVAAPEDAPAIQRLAHLDTAPPPAPVPMLLAEVDGELRAALPLAGGPVIANPFRHTAHLVALLPGYARGSSPAGR